MQEPLLNNIKLNSNNIEKEAPSFYEEKRPWGSFHRYAHNEPCTPKILLLNKKEALSLQFHERRAQHYYIIDPVIIQYSLYPIPMEITHDKLLIHEWLKDYLITEKTEEGNMYMFKPYVVHRVVHSICDREVARVFEVAYGYNDEEDIIRLDDKYGRFAK